MLITKEVEIGLNGQTVKHYESLGYAIPRTKNKLGIFTLPRKAKITVKVCDLLEGSHADVQCLCDYCLDNGINKIITKEYKNYIRENKKSVIHKDCCFDCKSLKTIESNQIVYDCENVFQLESTKIKSKETIIEKYDVEYITQSENIQDKIKQTNMIKFGCEYALSSQILINKREDTLQEKYGVSNISQLEEIKLKKSETFYNNQTVATSRQQKYLHKLLNGELNYHLLSFNLDITFPEEKIYIEYDGGGHDLQVRMGKKSIAKFNKYELDRYFLLKREGWKMFKIISPSDYLPSDQILLEEYSKAMDWFKSGDSGHSHYIVNIGKKSVDINYGKLRKIQEKDLEEVG